jgi:hypothetical protein
MDTGTADRAMASDEANDLFSPSYTPTSSWNTHNANHTKTDASRTINGSGSRDGHPIPPTIYRHKFPHAD